MFNAEPLGLWGYAAAPPSDRLRAVPAAAPVVVSINRFERKKAVDVKRDGLKLRERVLGDPCRSLQQIAALPQPPSMLAQGIQRRAARDRRHRALARSSQPGPDETADGAGTDYAETHGSPNERTSGRLGAGRRDPVSETAFMGVGRFSCRQCRSPPGSGGAVGGGGWPRCHGRTAYAGSSSYGAAHKLSSRAVKPRHEAPAKPTGRGR